MSKRYWLFTVEYILHHWYSSTVSSRRGVIFSSLSFIHIDLLLESTLVTISYSPDCVKTTCPLCTNISVCLSLCVFMFVRERAAVEGVSTRFSATTVCSILKNPWNYFWLCLSGLISAESGSLCKSHIDSPTHGYRTIDAQPRSGNQQCLSFCLCLKAYSEDGLSAILWALSSRCSDISDIMSLLLDFIQPDKQNCSWGEQTSGCQPPISLWTGLGPLPGNEIVLFHPTNSKRGIGCEKCLSLSILKACEDFVKNFTILYCSAFASASQTNSFGSIICLRAPSHLKHCIQSLRGLNFYHPVFYFGPLLRTSLKKKKEKRKLKKKKRKSQNGNMRWVFVFYVLSSRLSTSCPQLEETLNSATECIGLFQLCRVWWNENVIALIIQLTLRV